ncbi:MAG: helix-turn-helix domain-containing protein [Candidatus Omnitrophica bacterium]|nr:helix-turn-helix domain-containing protein [Candidatus Omnitrophota bacterium]
MDKNLEIWHKFHAFYQGSDYKTKDLADCLEVSCRTIQRWLKDTTTPPLDKLQLLCKYLSQKENQHP